MEDEWKGWQSDYILFNGSDSGDTRRGNYKIIMDDTFIVKCLNCGWTGPDIHLVPLVYDQNYFNFYEHCPNCKGHVDITKDGVVVVIEQEQLKPKQKEC